MKPFSYSQKTDQKWQKRWEETALYHFDEENVKNKYFLLEMFSYPSGETLHAGHWWNYSLADSFGRLKRMQGYNVFHPPGFDAFGLPAENYAVKTGVHPRDSTKRNMAAMEKQFRVMGTTYDWRYALVTCEEEYYRWTQWLFLKLYENGLAYRAEAPVNWCPSCLTVLANEQADGGICERCDSPVTQKNMTQWFFKITAYAEKLLAGLDALEWPDKTKRIQKNWIGKSVGAEILFSCNDRDIPVFTTRPDTLMGVSALVFAPEHPLAREIAGPGYDEAALEHKGVFTGTYAVHPLTKRPVPVFVSEYVLADYGTGAVMAVPAHDSRDFAFAMENGLPILPVVAGPDGTLPYEGKGTLINSGAYDGLSSEQAGDKIMADLTAAGRGRKTVRYRLRDWLVSRQRYWGAPIPIVYCDQCGIVRVPEQELPVTLPYDVSFRPDGRSPLAGSEAFFHTRCPSCGGPATQETDTLDTFVCSSWYYLRFYDAQNQSAPFDKARAGQILPVDKYVGGVEHATMHLLYARFVTKALKNMGLLAFDEPFPSLFHQGVITGKDGRKMSKRDGAVLPDALILQYGADVFRLFLGFCFSYEDGGPWKEDGLKAVARFAARLGRLAEQFAAFRETAATENQTEDRAVEPLEFLRHQTIRQVTAELEGFRFNTALARIMELANAVGAYQKGPNRRVSYEKGLLKDLFRLLAPLAPHLAEELWEWIGMPYSIHNERFPVADTEKLARPVMEIAVQVNGVLRDVLFIETGADEEAVCKAALARQKVRACLAGRAVAKHVYVPERLVNFVCG